MASALGITIGAAGVVATSLFYLLSPPETVLPFVPLDLVKATLGAARGAATLHIAGLFGIISDAIFGSAAMVFAARAALGKGAGGEALGWMLLGVGTLVFISVDTILGFVLPALAAASVAAFLGFKIFADVLFALGEVTFGLGRHCFSCHIFLSARRAWAARPGRRCSSASLRCSPEWQRSPRLICMILSALRSAAAPLPSSLSA